MELYLKALFSIITIYISIYNLSSFRLKSKLTIASVCLSEAITILILKLNGSQFVALAPTIIISIVFLYKSNKKIMLSIIIPLISMLIFVISSNFSSYIYISLTGKDIDIFEKSTLAYYIGASGMLILTFIFSKLIGVLINKKLRFSNLKLKRKYTALIILSVTLTFTIFYMNIILGNNTIISTSKIILLNTLSFAAYFVLLIIIMYILIKSITKDLELNNKQLQYQNLQQYTSNLENLYSEMRVFRHDYINILSSLVGYIESKDMEGLEKHFNENILPISKCIESNNFKLGLLKNIKMPELKGIVSSKVIRAQELGIDVYIDIAEPIESIEINIIDLCRIIGILIDNAVEAALKCDKPNLKIAFIKKNNSVIIIVINNYCENIPSIHKIFQPGFSTKGQDRGLGLSNLKEIIGNYSNISLDTIINPEDFIQNIEITHKI